MANPSGNVIQVGNTVKWGTESSTTYGMIQSINQGVGGQTKEYKDFEGSTKTLVIYDKHETFNISAICLAPTNGNITIPQLGDQVTIEVNGESKTFYVQSASIDWSNEEAARITISGRTYPTINQTP